jgi:hypothetical protein
MALLVMPALLLTQMEGRDQRKFHRTPFLDDEVWIVNQNVGHA